MSAPSEAARTDSSPDRMVTVVLPCLDEAESLDACITSARRGLRRAGLNGEILVVDNGSTDESVEIARHSGARVVTAPTRGYGSALSAGIRAARGDIVVMADADGTYDLTRLGELVEPVAADEADLVLGSRLNGSNRGTMPVLHRFVGTPVISFLLRRANGGIRVRDSQSGYRAFKTSRIRDLGLKATGMEFASEMLIRASEDGLRIVQRPIGYRRRTGESKLNTFTDGWRHLQLIVLLAPQLLLFWPGIAMLGVGVGLSGLSLAYPAGIGLGALRWQPIFFSPILLVIGASAALAGAVLTFHSALSGSNAVRRFSFVGDRRFTGRCITAGIATLGAGLLLEVVLFSIRLGADSPPARTLTLAGIAQALIVIGVVFAGFGIIYRIVGLGIEYRNHDGQVDILRFDGPPARANDEIVDQPAIDG